MIDEPVDVGFKVTRQVIVFQQDAVLQGLVPTLDLALGLWVRGTDPDAIFYSIDRSCEDNPTKTLIVALHDFMYTRLPHN